MPISVLTRVPGKYAWVAGWPGRESVPMLCPARPRCCVFWRKCGKLWVAVGGQVAVKCRKARVKRADMLHMSKTPVSGIPIIEKQHLVSRQGVSTRGYP
jgi:hypothetical protein